MKSKMQNDDSRTVNARDLETIQRSNGTLATEELALSIDSPQCQHYVVGVGASAGGLEALEKFFATQATDQGLTFVVIQHLSPDFESHMDQLLRRVTNLKVEVVENGVKIMADTIYLIPPKAEMVISNGRLLLTERSTEKGLNHPIDQFFRSLAQDCQRYAIGIILSGTGSDGSRGITEIAENGGLVIAQDPASCRFDAMPLNAQETGNVHLVLPPEAMQCAINKYIADGTMPADLREQQMEGLEASGLIRVFQLLQAAHAIDFSHYKPGTVERRIKRRMELLSLEDLNQYVAILEQDTVEINDLYKDLLIGVTRFFRDSEAYDFLQQGVFPRLIEKHAEEGLRIWVCGCATGEEAYSLAIGLTETFERLGRTPDFKMFATDAHKESLQIAAAGVYPEAKMDHVSQQRRDRFFKKRRDGFHVANEIRRNVVFAPHNVTSDPPFTQMHLVTCRNLLIYLRPIAQKKVLSLFHFALKQGGVLFLGPSESPGEIIDEFESLQKSWKIYRKRRDVRLPVELRMPLNHRKDLRGLSPLRSAEVVPRNPQKEILPNLYDLILGDLMPPSVLVDHQCQILHSFPGSEPFMRFVPGRPTNNVLEIIYPQIKNSLAAAMQHALRDDAPVRYSGMPHPNLQDQQVRLIVRPYKPNTQAQTYLLIQFETLDSEQRSVEETPYQEVDLNKVATSRIEALEQDLSYTQQNLQATIEELETSNEELQATNEEMVAANEELQSTNEELHSVNEELFTVNAEHQKRLRELDEANADMNNLLATTQVGVLFLDDDLYIRRFTPTVGHLLGIESNDVGRHVENYVARLQDGQFLQRLILVREQDSEQEWEFEAHSGTYLIRALPYQSGGKVSGVVVSFVNIDPIKRTEAELHRFKFMADRNTDAQVLVNKQAQVIYANQQMADSLGYSLAEAQSLTVRRFAPAMDPKQFQDRFESAAASGGEIFQTTHVRKDGTSFPVEVAVTFVEFEDLPYLFLTIRDITSRRKAENARRLLEKAIAAVDSGIVISDPTKKDNPLIFANAGFSKITGYDSDDILGENCRFLQGPDTDPQTVVTLRDSIRAAKPTRVLIQNYRKDGSPFWNDVAITPVHDGSGAVTAFVGIQNDVSDVIKAHNDLEDSERTIRLLLDSTAEGIYGIDPQGECLFCNASALHMLGYQSPDQLIGQNMHEAIHHHRADGSHYPIEECPIYLTLNRGEQHHREDDVFWRTDGSSFPVQYSSHPLMEDGKCLGAVVTFTDTTERKNELQKLKNAQELADAANAAKSRFLANMSHELRTPLAAILGFTQIMQQESADQDSTERLNVIHRNGEYLLRLLNDVLDLSRIESGKLSTALTTVQLDELISDVEQTMQMRTLESKTTLCFHLENPLPTTVTTDPARVRQIMINLIGNAIKFAPGGNVNVNVSVDSSETVLQNRSDSNSDSAATTFLHIEVTDNGIGMSDDHLEYLFQPFVQADNTISERFGGTGLGLSISKRLIEALEGGIQVESIEGKGSAFRLWLPVDPVGSYSDLCLHPTELNQTSQGSIGQEQDKIELNARVLLADDMRDIRLVANHFLSKSGCQVDIAENGRQAIDMIESAFEKQLPYDLIMMDVQMPEMDGEQAVKELRQRGIQTPIIALTADAMKGTRRRLMASGFDEYLTKPLDRYRLLQLAQQLLNRR